MKPRILWDITHLEFTYRDFYYFSHLKDLLEKKVEIIEGREPLNIDFLKKFDWIVFNYPERPFSTKSVRKITKYLNWGGRVFLAGYYQNEDNVADACSSLSSHFGIKFNSDIITDENGLPLIKTSKVLPPYNNKVKQVYLPCSCSLTISEGVNPVIFGEDYHRSNLLGASNLVLAAQVNVGRGVLFSIGTCVFWDNFSLFRESNLQFLENVFFKNR